MALTQVPIELSSTPGIVDNSNATAITIDSSENVGIGVSNPSAYAANADNLVIGGEANVGMNFDSNSSSGNGGIYFSDQVTVKGILAYSHTDDAMQFFTNGTTERMRIDASGNFLVGKTSADNTTAGTTIYGAVAPGAASFVRDAGNTLVLNRLTSDGEILAFRKDGTTVGSIGTYINFPYIGKSDVNLLFDPAGPHVIPRGTNGGARDGAINLGSSSNRFKDLYLSGEAKVTSTGVDGTYAPILRGVYSGNSDETNTIETTVSSSAADSGFKFNVSNGGGSSGQTEGLRITRDGLYAPVGIKLGGTGSANLLDDYEEGSWTPVYVGSTTAGSSPTGVGTYTKVGRLVTVTANFSNVTASGAAGNLHIDGLPFTAGSASNNAHHGATTISALGSTPLTSSILISESEIRLRSAITSIYTTVVNTSSIYLYTTITYETNE